MSMIDSALEWIGRGFAVFPVEGKRPIVQWGKHSAHTKESARAMWKRTPEAGIGIPTGARLNTALPSIVVVDVDGDAGWETIGERELPETFTTASGKDSPAERFLHFWYEWPDGIKCPSSLVYGSKVDIKGQGGYVVAPPSMHSSGNRYRIVQDIDFAPAPLWLVEWMESREMASKRVDHEPEFVTSASHDDVTRFAVEYLQNRAEPSIQGSNGARAMFAAALYLCRGLEIPASEAASLMSGYYQGKCTPAWPEKEFLRACERAAVASSKPRGFALEYVRPSVEPEAIDEAQLQAIIESIDAKEKAIAPIEIVRTDDDTDDSVYRKRVAEFDRQHRMQRQDLGDLARTSDNARELCAWLDGPQPALSMAAVLALGSAFCGRRIVTRTGLLCSTYIVGVAASGDGKGAAKNAVTSLVKSSWSSLFLAASWPSVQAAWQSVVDANTIQNHGITFHDNEIGKLFSGIFDKRANENKRGVARLLLDVNPSTYTDVKAAAQSLAAGGGESVILAPSVNVYGTTTPAALQDLLQSEAREDGLLARILWVRGIDGTSAPVDHTPKPTPQAVRGIIVDAKKAHEEWRKSQPPAGATTKDGGDFSLYSPTFAEYTDDAIDALNVSLRMWHVARVKDDSDIRRGALNRAQENAEKIACIIATIRDPASPVVEGSDVDVANAFVRRSIAMVAPLIERSDAESTPHGRARSAVLKALHDGPKGKTEISRLTQSLTKKERDNAIEDLLEQSRIAKAEATTAGRTRTVYAVPTGL